LRWGRTCLLIGFSLLLTSRAEAQVEQCNRLIELSKLKNQTFTDSRSFEQYQRAFCSDYQQFKSQGKAMSAGAAYGPISANYGQSSSNLESVASRYCEDNGSIKATSDMYRDYVETIAPGAFESYNNCLGLKRRNITFDLPPTAIKPTSASFIISNTDQNRNAFDELRFRAAPGITCTWSDPAPGNRLKLKGQSAATLDCQRSKSDSEGYVLVYAATLPNSAVTVPWEVYVDGAPTSVVRRLQDATLALSEMRASMIGSVVAFNATSCPVGWAPYVPAQGRFIRGIDSAGNIDPNGTRMPGNLQPDLLKSHQHSLPGVVAAGDPKKAAHGTTAGFTDQKTLISAEQSGGGTETRPINVALLYCERR